MKGFRFNHSSLETAPRDEGERFAFALANNVAQIQRLVELLDLEATLTMCNKREEMAIGSDHSSTYLWTGTLVRKKVGYPFACTIRPATKDVSIDFFCLDYY
mmetsp:Transcript_3028/g.6711  ORF Transcript_3028/g.6711 Transcript_3028/m.6711 type:complete len:102 (+) Transcript_3028:306-611(+)